MPMLLYHCRSDSDIPVPYGRTLPLETPKFSYSNPPIADLVPNWQLKRPDVLVAILLSHCTVPYRRHIIIELKKYLKVDVHGKCGDSDHKRRQVLYLLILLLQVFHFLTWTFNHFYLWKCNNRLAQNSNTFI